MLIKRKHKDTYVINEKESIEIYGIFYINQDDDLELYWWGFMYKSITCDGSHLKIRDTTQDEADLLITLFNKLILPLLDGKIVKHTFNPDNAGCFYLPEWNGDVV